MDRDVPRNGWYSNRGNSTYAPMGMMGIIQVNSADRCLLWLLESKLSFSFGLFLIAAPPGQVVDKYLHFYHTYAISG